MKVKFTHEELAYLNDKIALMQHLVRKQDFDDGTVRTLAKMKYKFTPNAAICFLNAKERAFLASMLNYRQQDLFKVNSITPEVDVIQGLIDKIGS